MFKIKTEYHVRKLAKNISSNNKILPKLWFPKILISQCFVKKPLQKSINQWTNTEKFVIYETKKTNSNQKLHW